MRGAVWSLEWRIARGRTRRWAWSVAVPLLLLVPVAASAAAPPHRATVYGLFVVFYGLFGAAAPVVRDADRGWIERLLLTGYGARSWLAERTAAHAAQDSIQLAPALVAVCWIEGTVAAPATWAATAGGVLLALLVGNLLGTVVAAAVRSLAEGALVSAAVGLVSLHLSGAFRPPAAESWQEAAAAASPFLPALVSLREVAGAGAAARDAAGPIPGVLDPALWAAPAGTTLLLFAGAWAAANWLAARLTGGGGEL